MKEKYNLGGSKHALKCVFKYILSILKHSISTGTYYKDTIHETAVHTIICRQINGTEQKTQKHMCGYMYMNSIYIELRKGHKPFAKSLLNKWS